MASFIALWCLQVPWRIRVKLHLLHRTPAGRLLIESDYIRNYLAQLSMDKGIKFDDPSSKSEIPKFIQDYDVDTSNLALALADFQTLNEFFFRKVTPSSRPVWRSWCDVLLQNFSANLLQFVLQ